MHTHPTPASGEAHAPEILFFGHSWIHVLNSATCTSFNHLPLHGHVHLAFERVADAPSHCTAAHTHAIARASEGAPVAAAKYLQRHEDEPDGTKTRLGSAGDELDHFRVT